tara:strand:- start:194 stop:1477 length:1284 start_codon:yes stop_codon:yes gene_type:complete
MDLKMMKLVLRATIASWFSRACSRAIDKVPDSYRVDQSRHGIKRSDFSEFALTVVDQLNHHGYEAYLVGGAIRDRLANIQPVDEDIVTEADPEMVAYIFSRMLTGFRAYVIGRRHRLVHVTKDQVTIEVSSFANKGRSRFANFNRLKRLVAYTSPIIADAHRRDLTINALYFCTTSNDIIDVQGGFDDVNDRLLRVIGDSVTRFKEDPVRILRMLSLVAKLDFSVCQEAKAAVELCGNEIEQVSKERLFLEICKLFYRGNGLKNYHALQEYRLFDVIFPKTACEPGGYGDAFCQQAFYNADSRHQKGLTLSPVFLFAIILWCSFKKRMGGMYYKHRQFEAQLDHCLKQVCYIQKQRIMMSQKLTIGLKDVYKMQYVFNDKTQLKTRRHASHPRFRAAIDFFILRAQLGEVDPYLAMDWLDYRKKNGK